MRSIWNGSISFGLVNIPVKLYAAIEDRDIKFSMLHAKCQHPLRYERVCPVCQEKVSPEETIRGYEFSKGRYVVITDEELASVKPEAVRRIDILNFVSLDQIDPIMFDKTYYLEPDTTGSKAYALLIKAMDHSQKIAVSKVVMRSKESLAALRVYRGVLALELMHFPQEIRDTQPLNVPDEVKIHENELKMAVSLIDSITSDFHPEEYENEYQQALLELIDKKLAGEDTVQPAAVATNTRTVDLMAALEQSLKAAEKQRDAQRKKTNEKKQA